MLFLGREVSGPGPLPIDGLAHPLRGQYIGPPPANLLHELVAEDLAEKATSLGRPEIEVRLVDNLKTPINSRLEYVMRRQSPSVRAEPHPVANQR